MKGDRSNGAGSPQAPLSAGSGGAPAALAADGRLTARERVELLLDAGSFVEFGGPYGESAAAGPATLAVDGVVTGVGCVNGRQVFVFARDRTAQRSAMSAAQAAKIARVQDLALRSRSPLVGLFDSDGARADEFVAALAGYGGSYRRSIDASGTIPQIAIVSGSCPGAEALLPALFDFVFMVGDDSTAFLSGPDVVQAVSDERANAVELGGAAVHAAATGLADGVCAHDVMALRQVRRLIDFLPEHHLDTPFWRGFDEPSRREPSLDTLVPQDETAAYDVRELIGKVADERDFFELKERFAPNLVTGLARIDGRTVGVVANQPTALAGVIDRDAAFKAARFVRFCDAFHLPVVTFVDAPGFLPGAAQEHGGIVAHVAQLLVAYVRARVPTVTIVVRRAYGAAWTAMGSRALGVDVCVAWHGARVGLADGAPAAAGARVHASLDDARQAGCLDGVIVPADTRGFIARSLEMLARRRVADAARSDT